MSNQRIDQLFNLPAIKKQLDTVYAYMADLGKRIEAANKSLSTLGLGTGGGRGAGGTGGGATGGALDALKQLEAAQRRLAIAESDLGKAIAGVNEKLRQQNLENRNAAKSAQASATSLDGMRARLVTLTRDFDRMSAAQRKAFGPQQVREIQKLQKEIRALENLTGRAQRNVGNYPKLIGGAAGFLGNFGIAFGAGAIGKQIFDTTVQLDSLNAALRAVSVTEAEYAKNQQFLIATSERLGLNILDLTQSYKLFYAAATQSGLTADTTRDIFNSVSEAAAVLKLSTQDTQGVLLAFSQILGKGKVQAEELRGQIGERLPGAFSIAARSIGVTEQQLNKMLEKGEVIAADFLPKFARELEKTFGVENEERVEGLQAAINRLSNTFTDLVSDNQSGLSKFFAGVIGFMDDALKGLNLFLERVQTINDKDAPTRTRSEEREASLAGVAGLPFLPSEQEQIEEAERIERERQKAKRDALIAGNDSYVKEFEKASAEVRAKMLKEAEQLEKITREQAAKLAPGILTSGNIGALTAAGVNAGKASRAQDVAFQEADRARRYREILAKEAAALAASQKKATGVTQAELDRQARMREMALKAALEAYNLDKQAAIDSQREIAEDSKRSFNDRLLALANFNTLRNEYEKENADYEKKILQEKVNRNQAVAQDVLNVDKKLAAEQRAIAKETQKLQLDILKDNVDKKLAAIISEGQKTQDGLERQASEELDALQKSFEGRLIDTEQYEFLELQLQNKYNVLKLQAEIETTKQILEIRRARGEDVSDLESSIFQAETKLADLGLELFKKREKAKTKTAEEEAKIRKDQEQQLQDELIRLGQETLQSFFDINRARFDDEKNRVDSEIELVRKKKQEEIEEVNASALSAQEKADRIAVINARAQAKEEELEARKRQIAMEQARFERGQAIAGIILNTSLAVIKTLAAAGPFALPLAATIGAIGAVQLATALATPLPRYFMGRDGGPAELARLNDGGRDEVVERPDGSAYIPQGRDVVVALGKGDKVHRSVDHYVNSIADNAHRRVPGMEVDRSGRLQIREDLQRQTAELTAAMARNKTTMVVKNTWSGLLATRQSAEGYQRYIMKNVFK